LIVQNGVVVATPPDSQDLFCRDVLTGAPRLAPQRAGAGRYVAGLRNENVVVVGERSITAVQLGTGKSAWECNYPSGLTLAGSGVWQTDSLLLPLSSQTVIRVSTDDGRIIDQIRVDQPLGNLYVHKDQLLSVSATAVSAFYTREALAEQVATKLAANPEDTWALTQRSQLALAENNLELAISSLTKSYELDPASADTRYLLVEALLRGLEIDFSSFEAIAQQYEDKIEFGPQRFRFLQQLALGKIRSGQPLAAFESLLELVPEVGNSFLATQHRPKLLELESEYTVDSNHWIAAELARAFANATQDDRRRMAELVALQLQTLDGVMVPLRREKLQYLQWLPDASEDLLDLAQELLGDDEQTIAEQLLQPLLFSSTASPSIQKARELIARPASADLQMMGPAGNRITPSYAADEQFESMRPKANASAANLDTAEVKWNSGRLQVKASRDGRYQFGATVDADSQRWGRPEFRVALSGSLVVVSNGNGEDIGHFEYPRASNDSSDVFTRATIRGGLLLIETGPEIAMFDVYRGLNSSADALLWRHSLFSPGTGPTREFQVPGHSSVNTPLGFTINRRQMPGSQQAIVGPLTPVGVLVQIGTRVIMLDALTGRAVWSRDGYDDNTRMTARDLEVAIVNPSLGSTQILDCRDGAILRKDKYEGDWRNWFSHNALMVDFSDSQTLPPQPGSLRVWDAITGREVQRLELSPGARADESERRYLVVYEPNSKLHYFDLENPDQVVYHLSQTKPQKNIATVSAERFQDRVVVLTSASKVQSDISDYVAHGDVYCLDAHTGEQQWTKPGQLFNMQIPKSQPRESPFLVAYRINQRVGNVSRATLAIIDLRSGRIAFSSNLLPLSASVGFAMTLRPLEQLIEMGLGARSLSFTVTDEPVPPQPIFVFGLTAKSASNPSELDGIFSDR
jgi:outer membrane protein assembly factor BamB